MKVRQQVLPKQRIPHFSKIGLNFGARLQIECEYNGEKIREFSHLVGILEGVSIILTTPHHNGLPLSFTTHDSVLDIRVFNGKDAFAFKTRVMEAHDLPFPYLHAEYPYEIAVERRVRREPRYTVDISAEAVNIDGIRGVSRESCRIEDLSASGALITAKKRFIEVGQKMLLKFAAPPYEKVSHLHLAGEVVSTRENAGSNASNILYGIEFKLIESVEQLLLKKIVGQQVAGAA